MSPSKTVPIRTFWILFLLSERYWRSQNNCLSCVTKIVSVSVVNHELQKLTISQSTILESRIRALSLSVIMWTNVSKEPSLITDINYNQKLLSTTNTMARRMNNQTFEHLLLTHKQKKYFKHKEVYASYFRLNVFRDKELLLFYSKD